MKNAIMLDVGDGVNVEIEFISMPATNSRQLMIELYDERALSEIAAYFENREKLVRTDTIRPGVETVYSGYTELTSIQRNAQSGAVRISLSKP